MLSRQGNQQGITLIETILYVSLLAMLVSAYVALLAQLTVIQSRTSVGGRLAENAAVALHFVTTSLEGAQSITVSSSTLGSTASVLRFTTASGTTAILDTVVVPTTFSGTTQNVRRLRYQAGGQTSYLTDTEVNVVNWYVDDVRTSTNDLSGLNIVLELEVLNEQSTGYRQGTVHHETTVSLTPLTLQL